MVPRGLISLLPVMLLTLMPGDPGGHEGPEAGKICFLCGQGSSADAVLNILLFLPFGWVLGRRLGVARTGGWALLISLAIEAAQVPIPGRFSSAGDLLSNTIGGCLGALATRSRPLTVRSAAVTATIGLFLPLLLLRPAPPEGGVYYGQWTAALGRMEVYRGRVVSAVVGETPVASGRSESTQRIRQDLADGAPISVRLIVGPAPGGQAPIFSIYDDRQRGAFMLGADGTDIFVRLWRLGTTARFQTPTWWWEDALSGFSVGDTVRATYALGDRAPCLNINGKIRCLAASADIGGWSLLAPDGRGRPGVAMAGFLWAFLLGAPFGMLSLNFRGNVLFTAGLGFGLAVLSWALPYWVTPWWGILLMFTGMIVTSLLDPWIRKTLEA